MAGFDAPGYSQFLDDCCKPAMYLEDEQLPFSHQGYDPCNEICHRQDSNLYLTGGCYPIDEMLPLNLRWLCGTTELNRAQVSKPYTALVYTGD